MALAAWLMLLAVAVAWGHALLPAGTLNVHAPPFQGHYRFLPRAVVPGASLAALGVVFLPWAAQRLPCGDRRPCRLPGQHTDRDRELAKKTSRLDVRKTGDPRPRSLRSRGDP